MTLLRDGLNPQQKVSLVIGVKLKSVLVHIDEGIAPLPLGGQSHKFMTNFLIRSSLF